MYPLSALCGQEEMKLALSLLAVNPKLRGVLLAGEKGTGKSTAARALSTLLDLPFVNLPLSTTEEALLGGLDLSRALKGEKHFLAGLLARAHGGILYVDEINLLAPHLLSYLLDTVQTGTLRVEREGISSSFETEFVLIGSMNPEEGGLSPQILDRFGLFVWVEAERDEKIRVEIIKRRLAYEKDPETFRKRFAQAEETLKRKLFAARDLLPKVLIPEELRLLIGHLVTEASAAGNRAEIFLLEATRAAAALEGRKKAGLEDLEKVAELVLRHRRRSSKEERKPPPRKKETEEQSSRKKKDQKEHGTPSVQSQAPGAERDPTPPHSGNLRELPNGLGPSEERGEKYFPVGEIFRVRDLPDLPRRLKPGERFGREGRALTLTGRGHFFRPVSYSGQGEIAFYATFLAAARRRAESGGHSRLLISPEDLRAKLKLTKTSKLLLFCVDGSGSMAAEARMKETKGAIMSLLISAYQRRHQAALLVFRRKEARFVLPPTSSVEFAGKILERLAVGGSTPLSHALAELCKFLETRRRLFPREDVTVILVTDGRGNVSLGGQPVKEEIEQLARTLRERFPEVRFLVVDTETGPVRLEMARRLASWLGASYFTPETLKAETLAELARKYLSGERT